LRYNRKRYWNTVEFRREKQQEAIRIAPTRNERLRRAEELLPPPLPLSLPPAPAPGGQPVAIWRKPSRRRLKPEESRLNWNGLTAPAYRVGASAPNRWAAEPPTNHPPFAYRAAYEAAGWRPIAPHEREISENDRRWPRNVDKECVSPLREYARELRKLEAQDARPKMRRVATGAFPGHAWQGGTPNQISREDWNVGGDKAGRPAYSVLQTDQLPPTIWRLFRNILATSPGRPRGRPPLGDRRMSDTERQRKRRAIPQADDTRPRPEGWGRPFKSKDKREMTDVCDLCIAIENMVRTADPMRRRAVARAFDGYARSFPANYEWAVSGQAPALLHFLMGSIEMTCAEAPSKPKPNLAARPHNVVEFRKMESAHV
jgi:hypothetical protein